MTSTDDAPKVDRGPVPTDQLLDFLRSMIEIRLFEDEAQRLFMANLVRGSTHLCSGQEAVVVGACAVLRGGDSMLCTYRGHGAVLAKGAPLDRTFGEILGKAEGLCGGKGGSMHLTDIGVGAYGSIATVGAHLPIAVGPDSPLSTPGLRGVCVCFFGDGATNIGAFHEALNLAAVWKLPVLFVCENNLYGEYSALRITTPIDRLADRATGLSPACPSMATMSAPSTPHCLGGRPCPRRRGLTSSALYIRALPDRRAVPALERGSTRGLARDPIDIATSVLLEQGVDQATLDDIHRHAEEDVRAASERAVSWAEPEVESRLQDVWA